MAVHAAGNKSKPEKESQSDPAPTHVQLAKDMTETTRDYAKTKHIKVENCIGFTKVPVGLAGPLTINGDNQNGTFHATLATLEATLVASCSRGCKAFQQGGGVRAVALAESMARAPIFRFDTIDDALMFLQDVPELFSFFQTEAEKTSRRAKLLRLTPHIIGSCVHVRFDYTTGASAGQNMTTIATHSACQAFLATPQKDKYKVRGFLTEGQFASDKKLAWGNVMTPRGVQVIAWATMSNAACKRVLGNDASTLYGTYLHGVQAGIRNGIQGYNINTANILAAMFIATGQDAASVLEGGWAQLTFEYNDVTEDLTVSVFFPSLPIGTVGGGTDASTQHEALEFMGCAGAEGKWKLAETIASFALALEVSTISAISNDTFSQSHQRLARAKL